MRVGYAWLTHPTPTCCKLAKGSALDIPRIIDLYRLTSWRTILPASDREAAMNAFCEHHRDNIRFGYRCFDRILLNGLIQPFQQPERVVGFFTSYRQLYPVSRDAARCRRTVSNLGQAAG